MKKRRRPPRDAAVFPSAPTLVISPSEILRRKTIAANRGSANYDSVGMPLLFLYAATLWFAHRTSSKGDKAHGSDADYEQEP